ncbi:DUF6192 family protein [Streptomyces sp. NPDC094038]|uniref:DUF6192 family protein n=1 Tax=Streptomyces sp. NPDC094038 TaxID=3366055 RepID=UPI00382BCB0E
MGGLAPAEGTPADGRLPTIHKILASIPGEQERFEAVKNPPPRPRGGPARWTLSAYSSGCSNKYGDTCTTFEPVLVGSAW